MAIEPIKGFYVHDEESNTDGIAKYDYEGLEGEPQPKDLYKVLTVADIPYRLGYVGNDGTASNTSTRYVRSATFVRVCKGSTIGLNTQAISDGYTFHVAYYSEAKETSFVSFTPLGTARYIAPGDGYVRFAIKSPVDITAADVDIFLKFELAIRYAGGIELIERLQKQLEPLSPISLVFDLDNITLGDSGSTITKNNSIATRNYTQARAGSFICAPLGTYLTVAEYSDRNISSFIARKTFYAGQVYTVEADCYIRVALEYFDARTIDDSLVSDVQTWFRSNVRLAPYRTITNSNELRFKFGYVQDDGTANESSYKMVYTPDYIFMLQGSTLEVPAELTMNVALYSRDTVGNYSFISLSSIGDTGQFFSVPYDCYVRFSIGTSASTPLRDKSIAQNLTCNIKTFDELNNWVDSLFRKDGVNYGRPPADWYECNQESYNAFSDETTFANLMSKWDELVNTHSDVFSKQLLGDSSDTEDGENGAAVPLYEYILTPKHVNTAKLPKLIIACGLHGYEKGNAFGLYYFIKDILENWNSDPVLAYLRGNIQIRLLPFANPYGFNRNLYVNANGVNINRNFSWNWEYVESGEQASGDEPFDQPEAAIIRDWVIANRDAFHYIDSHAVGRTPAPDFANVNWLSFADIDNVSAGAAYKDKYYLNIVNAGYSQVNDNTLHFNDEFALDNGSDTIGTVTLGGTGHSSSAWVRERHILSLTLEGNNGFPGDVKWSENSIKCNAEIFGNWIMRVICQLSKA